MSRTDNQDLIERYVYDVTRRLPEGMRKDIGEELRTLIEDMAEEQDVEAILKELGSPARLARKYRGDKDSLISGEYYDLYWMIVKITLICTGAGLVISQIVSGVVKAFTNRYDAAAIYNEYLEAGLGVTTIFGILLQLFAVITIIFILLEKYKVKIEYDGMGWTPQDLPEIPAKEMIIKKSSMIVDIVFSVLFAVLYVSAPHLMGVWVTAAGKNNVIQTIPIFNLVIWYQVLPLLLVATVLGILKSIVKLVQGCYNITVMIATAVCNIISFVLSAVVLKGYPIWNPDFKASLEEVLQTAIKTDGELRIYWDTSAISNVILIILAFSFILETGIAAYKALKNR